MRVCLLISLLLIPMFSVVMTVNARHPSVPRACDCSSIRVYPEFDTVRAGDVVSLKVKSTLGDDLSHKIFLWTISAGVIISGEGTQQIEVQTFEEMEIEQPKTHPSTSPDPHGFIFSGSGRRGPSITATVKLIDYDCECTIRSPQIRIGSKSFASNQWADMTKLEMSAEQVFPLCDQDGIERSSTVVRIAAAAFDPEDDVLVFNYTVTAGRIIGSGTKVLWDLTEVPPDAYTITVGADDGCGLCGKTISKTVVVHECISP
jgi:hypothetical protein